MKTSYSECYEVFLRHINDVEILYPISGETEEQYNERISFLLFEIFKSAVVKFFNSSTPLNRDDSQLSFENQLRPVEIEIIGLLMVKEYYRKQLNFLASLKHSFSDRDWKSHDKSNQMNQYRQLLKEADDEIKVLINNNSMTDNIGNFKGWWS